MLPRVTLSSYFSVNNMVILFAFIVFFYNLSSDWDFSKNVLYVFLGFFGGLVSNSTGAGGGIVFVPVFLSLKVEAVYITGSSIIIQCFGMSYGSYQWYRRFKEDATIDVCKHTWLVYPIIAGSYLSVFMNSVGIIDLSRHAEMVFRLASVLFLVLLLACMWSNFKFETPTKKSKWFLLLLFFIGLIGGSITVITSIGLGEFVAIVLIIFGFNTYLSIGLAVIVSALTLLPSSIGYLLNNYVMWSIVGFAIPGALLGARFGSKFTYFVGAKMIKQIIVGWVFLTIIFA